jgi:hypothetical protein
LSFGTLSEREAATQGVLEILDDVNLDAADRFLHARRTYHLDAF